MVRMGVTATEILVEAIESLSTKGISKVIVLAFDNNSNPIGWLSNIGDRASRLGHLELGKAAMIQDKD
jgi:hypothetical protein